jgi:hypothetical protein
MVGCRWSILGGVVDAPDFELDGIDLYLQRSLQRSPYRGKIKNPSTEEPDVPPQEQEENNN